MIMWRYANLEGSAVSAIFSDGHLESHSIMADSIQAWLAEGNTPLPYEPPPVDPKEQAKADLASTDKEMARIAEDLINVLLNKGLISTSELPGRAVSKLNDRANLRKLL